MHAKNILLTHFSARYPKMPQSEVVPVTVVQAPDTEGTSQDVVPGKEATIDTVANRRYNIDVTPKAFVALIIPCSDATKDTENASPSPVLGLAFDHASIRLGDMRKLNTYLPAIEQSFSETLDEEEPDPAQEPW